MCAHFSVVVKSFVSVSGCLSKVVRTEVNGACMGRGVCEVVCAALMVAAALSATLSSRDKKTRPRSQL